VSRRTLLCALALATLVAGCGSSPGPEGRADPSPALRLQAKTLRLGGTPFAVAVSRRAAWVADNTAGTVQRLSAADGHTMGEPVRVGRGPVAIAAGEGGIWVATGAGTVDRLDPVTGKRATPPLRVPDPTGIAAGEGSVWVTSRLAGTVTRMDPRTRRVTGAPIRVGRQPDDVAVGFGSVWVANADNQTVSRIDARTGKVQGKPIAAGAQVLAVTTGQGSVWVASTDLLIPGNVRVRRIDPKTGAIEGKGLAVTAGDPVDLASGFGRVWATDVGSVLPGLRRGGALRPIDTRMPRVERPVPTGQAPSSVAVGPGAVWTANAGDGTVTRVAVAR